MKTFAFFLLIFFLQNSSLSGVKKNENQYLCISLTTRSMPKGEWMSTPV
ncbi:hypothetical protein GLYMA_19G203350v4 [Glycine max]|nr:hypothetical protein GLYMA_19G203350v4 [Glycine max]KAH1078795.1 hypothetical protein GYH30_053694 [Glycine max]